MSRRRYIAWNGATGALTAALVPVTTGTTIKTMLQIKPTTNISIIEWGYRFDVMPTALVSVQLITTGTVAATVTAHVAAGIHPYDDAGAPASAVTLGTTSTGYTSSGEGSVTSTRLLGYNPELAQSFTQQFPLDREPGVVSTDYLRIRATTATAINMVCYVVWEE